MNLWKNFNLALKRAIIISLVLGIQVSIPTQAKVAVLDRVAAIVNDDIVLQSELDQRTASIFRNIQDSGTQPPALDILQKQLI